MTAPLLLSGATGGIGGAIASRIAGNGTPVVLLGRSPERLAETVHNLLADGIDASLLHTQHVDINDDSSVAAAAEHVLEAHGAPASLVHAAGDHPVRPLLETTETEWQTALNSKLLGAVRLLRAFGPAMRARGSGSIVLIAGLFRAEPSPLFPIGSALNAALGAVAKAASKDFGADQVRVNLVDPGPVDTARWFETCVELAAYDEASAEDIDRATHASIPLGRLATGDDVAALVQFLLSRDAAAITGGSFVVDGGMAAGLV